MVNKRNIDDSKVPCVICCSENDLQYLFEYSLISCFKKLNFLSEIFVITPNSELAKKIISEIFLPYKLSIHVFEDDMFLSKKEKMMCGWAKQQILKLRSNEITNAENILSIGADTIIIKELHLHKFYNSDYAIVNYRNHKPDCTHFRFELDRIKNIYSLLGINVNNQKENLRDYIFDIFLFNKFLLVELKNFLTKKFGGDYFCKIFPSHIGSYDDMKKIGEWSLYTIFAIEILKYPFIFQNGSEFLCQVHTHDELRNYNYKNEAVHFVRKDFDKAYIYNELKKNNIL